MGKLVLPLPSVKRLGVSQLSWILRKHDDAEAGESKQVANLEKHTVLALHRAVIKSDTSFMCAKLIFFFRRNRLTYLKIDYFCICN